MDFEDAEMLFRRAWNWRKENLGATNSDTLSSLQELAICLQRRDDYSSAEIEIFLQVATIFRSDFTFFLSVLFSLLTSLSVFSSFSLLSHPVLSLCTLSTINNPATMSDRIDSL
jgi:hypothetical protein